MFALERIQEALRERQLDGWLLYDFRNSNALARRVLQLTAGAMGTRRLFYWVPANGEPKQLVHRIESGALDHLPGEKIVYLKWQELEAGVEALLGGAKRVAMEYSPRNANPYVSRVDAGTVELVRSFGAEAVSSGDLIQLFEATWDEDQWQMHLEASRHTNQAFTRAWSFIVQQVRAEGRVMETAVQRVILDHFAENGLVTDHGPIVGVGPHAGDPHFETCPENDAPIRENDLVLIDLWAKLDRPNAVFSDLTRMGFVGTTPGERYAEVFDVVCRARDAAIDRVRAAFEKQEAICGWQVDEAARQVIDDAGYGASFIHRLGHSIGQETHGNGANMDNLEMRDERRVLPCTCFSIEPGIYLPEFGVRTEVDVFVDKAGQVHVTGGMIQREILPLFTEF